ncbi:hypothetical protein SLA2020_472470 [Shorea laevis]
MGRLSALCFLSCAQSTNAFVSSFASYSLYSYFHCRLLNNVTWCLHYLTVVEEIGLWIVLLKSFQSSSHGMPPLPSRTMPPLPPPPKFNSTTAEKLHEKRSVADKVKPDNVSGKNGF